MKIEAPTFNIQVGDGVVRIQPDNKPIGANPHLRDATNTIKSVADRSPFKSKRPCADKVSTKPSRYEDT